MVSRMRFSKKAQSAIEFLMTYGWAFMTAFLMIGALFYFGILDVSKLLPDRCEFASEFACNAFALVEDSGVTADPPDGLLKVKLVNNLGVVIELQSCDVKISAIQDANFCRDDDGAGSDLTKLPADPYNCGKGGADVNLVDHLQAGEEWRPGEEKVFYFSECYTSEYGMMPNSKQELLLTFEYKAVQSVYKHNITGRIVTAVSKRSS